jgi:hypothetical protein
MDNPSARAAAPRPFSANVPAKLRKRRRALMKYQHHGRAEWLGGLAGGVIGGLAAWGALSLLEHRGLEPSPFLLAMFLILIAGGVALAARSAGVVWRRVCRVRQQG